MTLPPPLSWMLYTVKSAAFRIMYSAYRWAASGDTSAVGITERIVEYPFGVRNLLTLPPQSSIAVLGCHSDLLTTMMAELDFKVTGIDVKHFALKHPNFRFVQSDLRKLSALNSGTFDAVAAVSTIEHVGLYDGDPIGDRTTMGEVVRILKPAGLLVLTVPFARHHKVVELHERIYDQQTAAALVAGFSIVEQKVYAHVDGMWNVIAPEMVQEAESKTNAVLVLAARKQA